MPNTRESFDEDVPKNENTSFFVPRDYSCYITNKRLEAQFQKIPSSSGWNCFVSIFSLMSLLNIAMQIDYLDSNKSKYKPMLTVDNYYCYNGIYALNVVCAIYSQYGDVDNLKPLSFWSKVGFFVDALSFLLASRSLMQVSVLFILIAYYLRLHRPIRYLWSLNERDLKSSILGTTLKYWYIFVVLRVSCALVWLYVNENEKSFYLSNKQNKIMFDIILLNDMLKFSAEEFVDSFYNINKMFIPLGPVNAPKTDSERVTAMVVMLIGCLMVKGAAVASLSIVVSVHMRAEETFRERYRLIMKEMKDSHVTESLRNKVQTFYKMFWHKQRAVSATRLLPTYPPTISTIVGMEIYFEAIQKCHLLRDMTYHFLSELTKKMKTIHYIPGDTIRKRKSPNSALIYITCGDTEMLTAEDDSTPILRLTRGTLLSPYAACTSMCARRSQVEMRAGSFCTAHVLHSADVWRVALKYGRHKGQNARILLGFFEHLNRVITHYASKAPQKVKFKSSILYFKRNLMSLKEQVDDNGKLQLSKTDVFLEIAGYYVMRNRADSSLTDEADEICLRPTFPCILQPSSSLLVAWEALVAILTVICCILHPYYLIFTPYVSAEFKFFDILVTAVFLVDIIVYLSTGTNVEEGVAISISQTASKQMRSYWFFLDVLSSIPIFEFIHNGHFAGINKLLKLPKVFRLLKELEDVWVYHSNVLRFLSYTFLVLMACYLIGACQQGLLCFNLGYCEVTNFTHAPYWSNGETADVTNRDEHRLMFCLYWAMCVFTTTTHLQTLGIDDTINKVFTMVLLEVCMLLQIFIEAVYSATIMVTTAMKEDFNTCIASASHMLTRNEVDPIVKQRFITYLQLCWYTDKAYSTTNKKQSIFHDLPPHVYQNIVETQRSKYLLSIPFMKFVFKEDLKHISSKLRLFYTSPNEILLDTGDICNEIYIIKQGICEIVNPDTLKVVGQLGNKSHFGVLECVLRFPGYYTIRAATHVQVFSIAKKHLEKVLELPQIKDAIDYAKEQVEYGRLQIHRRSCVTYKPPQKAPNREFFRLPRKYEHDHAFLAPFNRLGFLSFLRYIFPRFSIRPDGDYLIYYEWFRGFCAVCSAMIFPGYTYLVLELPYLYYFATFLDYFAYFDICQRMLVGYFDEKGILISHPSSTTEHYIKGAFVVDLLGCLPLEKLEPLDRASQHLYKLTKMHQILMLNRLLQLYRLPGSMRALKNYLRRDIFLVIKAMPIFLALLNTLTCLVVFCSIGILCTKDMMVVSTTPFRDPGGSWIYLFQDSFEFNLTQSLWNLHLGSYFWVVYVTTSTGYGTIQPTNHVLMAILFFGMFIGRLIVTYYSVRIISVRSNVNQALAGYQQHVKDMVTFMQVEKLDESLMRELLDYYEYNWDKMGGIENSNVLKLCDQITLRTQAILQLYGETFSKCPVLFYCDMSLLRLIGRAVSVVYFLDGTCIIQKDDVIEALYFVHSGTVEVETENSDYEDDYDYIRLGRGSLFGNLCDTHTTRYTASVLASSDVQLLQINAAEFFEITAEFPTAWRVLEEERAKNKLYIMGSSDGEKSLLDITDENYLPESLLRKRTGLLKYLHPHSVIVESYIIFVSMMCIYADVFNAAFRHKSYCLIVTLYLLDIAFFLKILLRAFLPYLTTNSTVKKLLFKGQMMYYKDLFKYDILSCLLIEHFCHLTSDPWFWFCILRLNRFFRIVSVYKILKRHHERVGINLVVATLISVFIWFTLLIHTTSCIWYSIGAYEEQKRPKSSWMYDDGKPNCNNLYICSVYFILTTFTQNGVGDVMPRKQTEVIFVIVVQIISTMACMMYVGEFSNIYQYRSHRAFDYYCKFLEVQDFLKNNRVSRKVRFLVHKYSIHLWREGRGVQMPYFLSTAPHCLRLNVMSAVYMHHLEQLEFFKDCEPAFLRQLAGCLQPFYYNKGMFVVKEHDITDSMYLVHKGRVLEMQEKQSGVPKVYRVGSCFGMLNGLQRDIPFIYSYKTYGSCQVLTLHLKDWEYLLEHYPATQDKVNHHLADLYEKYDKHRARQTYDDDDVITMKDLEKYFDGRMSKRNTIKYLFREASSQTSKRTRRRSSQPENKLVEKDKEIKESGDKVVVPDSSLKRESLENQEIATTSKGVFTPAKNEHLSLDVPLPVGRPKELEEKHIREKHRREARLIDDIHYHSHDDLHKKEDIIKKDSAAGNENDVVKGSENVNVIKDVEAETDKPIVKGTLEETMKSKEKEKAKENTKDENKEEEKIRRKSTFSIKGKNKQKDSDIGKVTEKGKEDNKSKIKNKETVQGKEINIDKTKEKKFNEEQIENNKKDKDNANKHIIQENNAKEIDKLNHKGNETLRPKNKQKSKDTRQEEIEKDRYDSKEKHDEKHIEIDQKEDYKNVKYENETENKLEKSDKKDTVKRADGTDNAKTSKEKHSLQGSEKDENVKVKHQGNQTEKRKDKNKDKETDHERQSDKGQEQNKEHVAMEEKERIDLTPKKVDTVNDNEKSKQEGKETDKEEDERNVKKENNKKVKKEKEKKD